MPTVNERCKILRSLNRVYVFEIVLLLVPRLKILRRRGLSYFGIFEKQEAQSSSQETNHNKWYPARWRGGSIFQINLRRRNAVNLIWTSIYNETALRRRSYAASRQRQFVSK